MKVELWRKAVEPIVRDVCAALGNGELLDSHRANPTLRAPRDYGTPGALDALH